MIGTILLGATAPGWRDRGLRRPEAMIGTIPMHGLRPKRSGRAVDNAMDGFAC